MKLMLLLMLSLMLSLMLLLMLLWHLSSAVTCFQGLAAWERRVSRTMCSFGASGNVAGVACLNAERFERDAVWIVQALGPGHEFFVGIFWVLEEPQFITVPPFPSHLQIAVRRRPKQNSLPDPRRLQICWCWSCTRGLK